MFPYAYLQGAGGLDGTTSPVSAISTASATTASTTGSTPGWCPSNAIGLAANPYPRGALVDPISPSGTPAHTEHTHAHAPRPTNAAVAVVTRGVDAPRSTNAGGIFPDYAPRSSVIVTHTPHIVASLPFFTNTV